MSPPPFEAMQGAQSTSDQGISFQILNWIGLSGLVIALPALLFTYFFIKTIYRIYFHPLSSYPGPKLAAATRLWYIYHMVNGNLAHEITRLHEKYGTVVRVAPDELSYTSSKCWNDIYGFRHGKPEMAKESPFYKSKSTPNTIVNAPKERHGFLRRLMSRGFSEAALRDQEPTVKSYVDLLMRRLGDETKAGRAVDMTSWYNFLTFDIIGDLAFGEPFGCLDSSTYHPWVSMIFDSIRMIGFSQARAYYPLLRPLTEHLIPSSFKQKFADHSRMTREKALRRRESKVDKNDLISNLLKPENGITDEELFGNSMTLIVAGSETTATVLAGVTWYLLKNRGCLERLKEEVRGRFGSEEEVNFVGVGQLKYLLACLNEAMRMFPPAPVGHPRIVPGKGEEVDGKFVPGGTQVSIFRYAANLSSHNFSRPNEYHPERWLGVKEFEHDDLATMQPFSYGPRNCIGKNLAYVEMRMVLARLLYSFDIEFAEGMEGCRWDECKIYITAEKAPLWIRLKPVVRG